jgi:hypothetical protein
MKLELFLPSERAVLDEALVDVDPEYRDTFVKAWVVASDYYTQTWLKDAWGALLRAEKAFEHKKNATLKS